MVCFVYLTMKWQTVLENKPHDSYAKMPTIRQAELFHNILLSLSAPIYKLGITKQKKQYTSTGAYKQIGEKIFCIVMARRQYTEGEMSILLILTCFV